jgi:hypothetical protein
MSVPEKTGALVDIKNQNQTVKIGEHSLVIGAAETTKTSPITYNGPVKHILMVTPAFTNDVTATLSLIDASGRVLWTGPAKARSTSNNLEIPTEALWAGDQLVNNTMLWKITLSGVPGGTGGTVVLVPRYYGV